MKLARTGIIVSALPGLITLGLFYSLALHVHQSLGRWPTGTIEPGFSPWLLFHKSLAVHTFEALFLSSLLLAPVAFVVCLAVQRWRRFMPYLALYAGLFFVYCFCMQFAPDPFLYWWRNIGGQIFVT